ncbi:hypothetical protein [uncultured Paracoccus sp.]|jgi:hypothetical protein|uniref:hypothetical protein n=1 Tax=Brevundimonas diminuta TaxID=293 RepID=UPI0025DE92DC|nr:hypothetical protein [uncultured Paracoccus sp.]
MPARPRRTGPVLTDAAREAFAAALVVLLALAFAGAALERTGPAQPLPDHYRIR